MVFRRRGDRVSSDWKFYRIYWLAVMRTWEGRNSASSKRKVTTGLGKVHTAGAMENINAPACSHSHPQHASDQLSIPFSPYYNSKMLFTYRRRPNVSAISRQGSRRLRLDGVSARSSKPRCLELTRQESYNKTELPLGVVQT